MLILSDRARWERARGFDRHTKDLMDARSLFLTANSTTVYVFMCLCGRSKWILFSPGCIACIFEPKILGERALEQGPDGLCIWTRRHLACQFPKICSAATLIAHDSDSVRAVIPFDELAAIGVVPPTVKAVMTRMTMRGAFV
jgi:hypothetical protein